MGATRLTEDERWQQVASYISRVLKTEQELREELERARARDEYLKKDEIPL